MAKTTALLDHDRAFSFIVNTEAGAAEVAYIKIGAPHAGEVKRSSTDFISWANFPAVRQSNRQ